MVHGSPLAISWFLVNSRGGLLPMLSLFRGGFLLPRGSVLPLQAVQHFLRKKIFGNDFRHQAQIIVCDRSHLLGKEMHNYCIIF